MTRSESGIALAGFDFGWQSLRAATGRRSRESSVVSRRYVVSIPWHRQAGSRPSNGASPGPREVGVPGYSAAGAASFAGKLERKGADRRHCSELIDVPKTGSRE
jgi:hypothetical protein